MKAKYYEALARAIKVNTEYFDTGYFVIARTDFLKDLCTILKAENPKFDEVKFRELLK